jgi:hypothetical protein
MRCRAALVVSVLLAQLGGGVHGALPGPSTPGAPALDQLERSVRRPLPTLPPPALGAGAGDIWVPTRIVPLPGEPGGLIVPGHWERRISDRETYVPPLTATTPDGRTVTIPGGVMRAPGERQNP